ncbi:delta-60 repeat domain-containing protein [Pseudomonas sp. CVAP|uniref:delta-60 repeat domain-containing protein n=1 Tax=Pseudomonas sp. CVAP\|nr:delta-60 repeat domain-containing protein [Pseudomonas sp. CVAP\
MSQYTALTARAAGDLDPTFGDKNGKKVLAFPNTKSTTGRCIVEGPDGKIYVGGGVDAQGIDAIQKLGVARLHKDGSSDDDFGIKDESGKGGFVIVTFGPMQDTQLLQILFLTVGGEPRILLSGIDTIKGEAVLARLHLDGRVDERFGVKGLLTVKLPENLSKVLGLEPPFVTTTGIDASGPCTVADGKIYVVTKIYMPIWVATVAVLIRLNSDGSFDTSFNKTGYVAVTNQALVNSTLSDVLVLNGKIIVCGKLNGNAMVACLNDDGTFNTDFDEMGFKLFPESELTFEKLSPYGKTGVLVAGWGPNPRHGVLACLTEKGELEPTFNDAKVLFQSFGEGSIVLFFGVGLADGKIIVSGRLLGNGKKPAFVVARFLLDGTLDHDFGHGKGWSSTEFANNYTVAHAMALQEDGKVLVAGDWGFLSPAALIACFLNPAASR